MSNAEILASLPNLRPDERDQLLARLFELQESDRIGGVRSSDAERKVLDHALSAFEADGDRGKPWREVLSQIKSEGKP